MAEDRTYTKPTNFGCAQVSPSMYRSVVSIERWPASSWTSRKQLLRDPGGIIPPPLPHCPEQGQPGELKPRSRNRLRLSQLEVGECRP
jgi:hypothetical protein